jgi:methionyl-tRNA formyltransferase
MPGAWTVVQGEKLRIFDVKKRRAARVADVVGKPGEICAIGESGVQITVQGGRLDILKVRVEGGGKMPAQQFAAAAGLEVGDLFAGEAARRTAGRKVAS